MKIRIITHAPFPEGLATTNRVFYHAKGLQDNGADVKVYVALPTESKNGVKNTETKGSYKGISFEYLSDKTERSGSFIRRRFEDFITPIKAGIRVVKDKPDAVVVISYSSIYVLFVLKILLMLRRFPLIVEETELPLFGKKDHGLYKLRNKLLLKIMFKNLDGFLVISHELIKRYSNLVSKNCPIVLIPVIVDADDIYDANVKRTKNLVYTGPLLQKKDGILTIIEAFTKIYKQYPDTYLICTGNLEKTPERENILKLLEADGVKDKVVFKGFVTRQEMIELLNSAAGLVLAKPSSDQADTCFPTKLGEYLATGNPIVVTSTGEIPLYLKDGVDSYIAEPDSTASFAEKLKQLLSDPVKAAETGRKGKITAQEKFNYKNIAMSVINLINNLKEKK